MHELYSYKEKKFLELPVAVSGALSLFFLDFNFKLIPQ